MEEHYVHVDRSQNFRMSELEAAWLRLALDRLEAGNDRRRAIAGHYRGAAPLEWQADHPEHVHHLAVFRSADRRSGPGSTRPVDGVATAIHYPLSLTQQPAYRELTRRPCPESEAWAASCVTVPCFPELRDDEVGARGRRRWAAWRRTALPMAELTRPEPVRRQRVGVLSLLQRRPDHRRDGHRRARGAGALRRRLRDHRRQRRLVRRLRGGAGCALRAGARHCGSSATSATRATARPSSAASRAATKEWVFYTDGDGQYDASGLDDDGPGRRPRHRCGPGLEAPARATRGTARCWGGPITTRVRLLFDLRVRDTDCDYRLFRRALVTDPPLVSSTGVICVEMMRRFRTSGARIVEVPVAHSFRPAGRSQFFRLPSILRSARQLAELVVASDGPPRHLSAHAAHGAV